MDYAFNSLNNNGGKADWAVIAWGLSIASFIDRDDISRYPYTYGSYVYTIRVYV